MVGCSGRIFTFARIPESPEGLCVGTALPQLYRLRGRRFRPSLPRHCLRRSAQAPRLFHLHSSPFPSSSPSSSHSHSPSHSPSISIRRLRETRQSHRGNKPPVSPFHPTKQLASSARSAAGATPIRQCSMSRALDMLCPDNIRCGDGECEFLHFPSDQLSEYQRLMEASPEAFDAPRLVICSGPERSGSTWLFNVMRLVIPRCGAIVLPYWIHTITEDSLQRRGFRGPPPVPNLTSSADPEASSISRADTVHAGACSVSARGAEESIGLEGPEAAREVQRPVLLVKTHDWSDRWDPQLADAIFVTDRDPCDAAESYLRVGWLPKDLNFLLQHMESWKRDHTKWCSVASVIVPYDDIVDCSGDRMARIIALGDALGYRVSEEVAAAVAQEVEALGAPAYGAPDPVSKLWPQHRSGNIEKGAKLPQEWRAVLQAHLTKS